MTFILLRSGQGGVGHHWDQSIIFLGELHKLRLKWGLSHWRKNSDYVICHKWPFSVSADFQFLFKQAPMWRVLPTHLPLYSKPCSLLPNITVIPPWGADVMDPEVWSELPNHIIYKILALLPLRDFLRLRWVCRRWSQLMESPVFLDEFFRAKVERPWFAIVAEARKVSADPQLYA